MYLKLKKLFLKGLGKKYIRVGECLQCGQCCRCITLRFPDRLITRPRDFEYLQKHMPRFKSFYISGQAENGVLLFTCKYLEGNKCSVHWYRSVFCRVYPHFSHKFIKMGGQPLEGCGFGYEPIESFQEALGKAAFKSSKSL